MTKNAKTKFKLLRPDQVWQPHRGGRPGNSNALKTGLHTAEVRDLRRRLRAFHARVNALLKDVDEQLRANGSRGDAEPRRVEPEPVRSAREAQHGWLPPPCAANCDWEGRGAQALRVSAPPREGIPLAQQARAKKATGPHDGGPATTP